MSTASDILSIASKEVGIKENPYGSNRVKYNTEYYGSEVSGSSYPWCVVFVWWVFKYANASNTFCGGEKTASVSYVLNWYKSRKAFTNDISSFKPGDLIIFDWNGSGSGDHIGIVESINSDGSVNTIEGNTTEPEGVGSEGVYRRVRKSKVILGACRPSYDGVSQEPLSYTEFSNELSGDVVQSTYTFSYSEYESLASLGTQPFHAMVDLWLGVTHIPQIPPQYLLSCEITMLNSESASEAGSAVSVTITLFDKYCDELEYMFIVNQNDIKLRFGDTQGRQSTVLNLIAKHYNINFRPNGNILTVQLTSNGYGGDASSLVTLSGGTSPSDAVKAIANKMGWAIGRIEESIQLEGQGGEFVEFNLINDNPVDYIRNEIAPRAIRPSDGKGGFQFYLDPTTNPNTVNFFPIDLEPGGLRTYVYQKGKNSPVIDFSITDTITLAQSSLASEYRASGVDPLTKEEFSIIKSYSDTVMDVSVHNKTSISDKDNPKLIVTDNSSRSEISAETAYRFTTHINGLNGTLTIIGDPTISITDMVRIIILNNDNTMHPISGIYQVKGVNHNITSGTMITTLNVVKTSNIMDASTTLKSAKVVD